MNLESASKNKLITYLSVLRDKETAKSTNEMDTELIMACCELLLDLQDKENNLSTEDVDEKVRAIPFAEAAPQEDGISTKKENITKINKKKLLLIAAVVAILVAVLSFISTATQWDIFDGIINKFGAVSNTPLEEPYNENGVTFVRYGNATTYKDINEFFENESLDILLPKELPEENMYIKSILVSEIDGKNEISVHFSYEDFNYSIYKDTKIPEEVSRDCDEIVEINGKTCYIDEMEDVGLVMVHFSYNNSKHTFMYKDKQLILDVINNLEES